MPSAEWREFGLLSVGTKDDDSNIVIVTNPDAHPGDSVNLDGIQSSIAEASRGSERVPSFRGTPLLLRSRYHESQPDSSAGGETLSTPSELTGDFAEDIAQYWVVDTTSPVFPWRHNSFTWDMETSDLLLCSKKFPLQPRSGDIATVKNFYWAPSDKTALPGITAKETPKEPIMDLTFLPEFIRDMKDEIIKCLNLSWESYYTTAAAKRKRGKSSQSGADSGNQQARTSPGGSSKPTSSIFDDGSRSHDGEDGDDGGDKKRRRRNRKSPGDKVAMGETRYVACPFQKWKPERFHDRCIQRFSTINYLKQHLRDFHYQRYCPKCFGITEDDNGVESLADHGPPCEKKRTPLDFVAYEARKELKKLRFSTSAGISLEDQWRRVYRLLFQVPEDQPCPDPSPRWYNMDHLELFVAHHGLKDLNNIFTQREEMGLFPALHIDKRRLILQAVQEWFGHVTNFIKKGSYSDISPIPPKYLSSSFGSAMWPGALDPRYGGQSMTVRPGKIISKKKKKKKPLTFSKNSTHC